MNALISVWNCHFGAVQLYCNRYSNDCFVYRRNSPFCLNGIKLPKNRIMKLFYFNSSKWELIAERKMPEYRITILLNALHTAAQFRYISLFIDIANLEGFYIFLHQFIVNGSNQRSIEPEFRHSILILASKLMILWKQIYGLHNRRPQWNLFVRINTH